MCIRDSDNVGSRKPREICAVKDSPSNGPSVIAPNPDMAWCEIEVSPKKPPVFFDDTKSTRAPPVARSRAARQTSA